jgi:hypothetical protein
MRDADQQDGESNDRRDGGEPPGEGEASLPELIRTGGVSRGPAMRVALLVAALCLFALGIVFWLIPVVTGVPFYVLAAITAGMASKRAARWINRLDARLPHRLRLLLRSRRHRGPEDSGPR